ncbi:signal peptidase I [Bacillus sp. FJAT-45066]|uniref:signal peptidase I n=1 Tax=Bacillus sp. FJAT-45066 TaxID=2011010 RepID=UPI000BB8F281|nr:signal peptidase I [Bacillus sp. FJAT-45066]
MINKIGKLAFYGIVSILVLFFVFTSIITFQSRSAPNEVPSVFGISSMIILSDSMKPVFQAGDTIFSKKVSGDQVSTGDIITFKQDNIFVTHRITDVVQQEGKTFFETKGDNVVVADDSLLAAENVVAKQMFTIPKLGYITQFASTPLGMALIFGLPFVLYVGLEIYDRFFRRKQTQQAA